MLLVCGGSDWVKNQNGNGEPIVVYPPVMGIVDESDPDCKEKINLMLAALNQNEVIGQAFVVRLSNKTIFNFFDSEDGEELLKRNECEFNR